MTASQGHQFVDRSCYIMILKQLNETVVPLALPDRRSFFYQSDAPMEL